jgi:4-hydroxy-2-oxoglutarate aldolase
MSLTIEGVFAPIPTAFDADGNLLLSKFSANLTLWNQTGLHGFVVLGSNGEAVMLSESEKIALWETAREAIPRDKRFFVGAGVESTRNCISLAKRAAEIGADAAMFVTPNYYRAEMKPANLINHYRVIADASPIPTIVYNMPIATGVDMDAATVIALAEHPNIVGIKDSGGNVAKFGEVVRAVRPDFTVIAGSGSYFYPALCVGARAAVAAVANVAPRQCVAMYEAFLANDHETARRMQLQLIPLNNAVTARWNIPGLKAALEELQQGYYGGSPRLPLRPLPDADRQALRQIMQQAGVI